MALGSELNASSITRHLINSHLTTPFHSGAKSLVLLRYIALRPMTLDFNVKITCWLNRRVRLKIHSIRTAIAHHGLVITFRVVSGIQNRDVFNISRIFPSCFIHHYCTSRHLLACSAVFSDFCIGTGKCFKQDIFVCLLVHLRLFSVIAGGGFLIIGHKHGESKIASPRFGLVITDRFLNL